MSSYDTKDFSKMRVNVVAIDAERNCLKENEWLAKVFYKFIDDADLNSLKGITINLMVRAIVICYDPNSPLVTRIQDIKQRKIEAFKLLNVKTYKDGRFSSDVDDIILGKNEKFNMMSLQFLKSCNNFAYSTMSMYIENYYQLFHDLTNEDGKKKAETMVLIDKIEDKIRAKAKEFFMQDDNLINYVASENIYEETDALTPEAMAKKFKMMRETIE